MPTLDDLNREGEDRLYPSITNPNWLVLRQRREIFRRWINGIPGSDLKVLDVGGRVQPYRTLLRGRSSQYWAVDLLESPLVNVVARAERIPFQNDLFDIVVCTQVLQYIQESRHLISEVHRVLKPGGRLLLSVPAIFPCDSERDLWRFMPESLQLLLTEFADVEIAAEGSSVSGFFRFVALNAVMLTRPHLLSRLSSVTLVPILNLCGAAMEAIIPSRNQQFSANFSALARK